MRGLTALALVAVLGLTGFALADGYPTGAKVETGLFARVGGEDPGDPGAGELVGLAKLEADGCENYLEVEVEVAYGMPDAVFDVYVKTNGDLNLFAEALETDDEGEGEFETTLDISGYGGDSLAVQVVVKPAGSTELDGYATATEDLPLLPCEVECDEDEVETGLFERLGGEGAGDPGSGDMVGEVELEADGCESELEVEVEVEYLPPESYFDVYVKINDDLNLFAEALMTDEDGEGEFETTLDIMMYGAGSLYVQVVVKPAGSTELDGYATDTVPVTVCECEPFAGYRAGPGFAPGRGR